MKRFYKLVTHARDNGAYQIHLDGKPVRTPSGQLLSVPSADLADHVVQEWAAQGEKIDPETMPLTQILTTALDRVGEDRRAIEKSVLAYLDTDLLCYRAALPEELAARQAKIWGRWLDWFAGLSGVMLATTTTISALSQDRRAHDFVADFLSKADPLAFTAVQMVTAASGSVVLGLAFALGEATADDVFTAAQLEELYRSEIYNEDFYGRDPHQEKIQNALLRDLNAMRLFLDTQRA